jgi:2TM family of unknown function (DUF5676)
MRFDTRAFAIAAGITAALLFTLCAAAVAIAPGPTTAFFGYIVHLDMSGMRRELSVASFIFGLIAWTLGMALTFGCVAMMYNRLIGPVAVKRAAATHATV